jgi:hypothetical protein
MNHPHRLIAILPISITVPQHIDSTSKAETFLAGVGLLDVRHQGGVFSFDLGICSIGAGTSEQLLIEWLLPWLPDDAVLLGYKLAEDVFPALNAGAGSSDPQLALDFVNQVSRLVSGGHVDVADAVGGAGAARVDDVCRERGLPAEDMSYDRLFSAWSIGRVACLDEVLATNVVGLWRLWLMTTFADQPLERARAEAALSCWLSSRGDDLAQAHRTGAQSIIA